MCLGATGRIVDILSEEIAKADILGNEIKINIRLTPQAEIGDYVLIHAGFAMEIMEEDLAKEKIRIFGG